MRKRTEEKHLVRSTKCATDHCISASVMYVSHIILIRLGDSLEPLA